MQVYVELVEEDTAKDTIHVAQLKELMDESDDRKRDELVVVDDPKQDDNHGNGRNQMYYGRYADPFEGWEPLWGHVEVICLTSFWTSFWTLSGQLLEPCWGRFQGPKRTIKSSKVPKTCICKTLEGPRRHPRGT